MHVLVRDMLCAADGHARACVHGEAMYTHRHRHTRDAAFLQPHPLPFQTEFSCNRSPVRVTEIPCLAHAFRAGI